MEDGDSGWLRVGLWRGVIGRGWRCRSAARAAEDCRYEHDPWDWGRRSAVTSAAGQWSSSECCGDDPRSSTFDVISRTCRHRPITVQTFPTQDSSALVVAKWVRIGLWPRLRGESRNQKRNGSRLSIQFRHFHFLLSPLVPSSPSIHVVALPNLCHEAAF